MRGPGANPGGPRSDWIKRNTTLVKIIRKVFACNHRVSNKKPDGTVLMGAMDRVDRCTICVSPAERRVLNLWFERVWGIER